MVNKVTKTLKKELIEKEILTSKEASLFTGMSANRLTLRRYEGLPPQYFKVEGRVFYKVCELEDFLKTYPLQGIRGRKTPRRWYDDGSHEDDIDYFTLNMDEWHNFYYPLESDLTLEKAKQRLKKPFAPQPTQKA